MDGITDLIVDVQNPVVMTGNFRAFCADTRERLLKINRAPVTEEEFVTAKKMIKVCQSTEKKLDGAREILMGKLGDAQKILAEFQGLSEETRSLRLDLNRAVTEEEEKRKKRLLSGAVETAEGYFIGTPYSLSVAEITRLKKCLLKRSERARREALDLELGGIESVLIARVEAYEENLAFLGSYPSSLFPDAEELAVRPSAEVKAEAGRRALLREIEEKETRERITKEAEAKAKAEEEAEAQAKADRQEKAEAGVDAFVAEVRGFSDKSEGVKAEDTQDEILPPPGFPGAEEEVYIAEFRIKVSCSGPEKFEDLFGMIGETGQVDILDYRPINF